MTAIDVAGRQQAPRFDFRRPNQLGREATRSLEVAHELFTRRVASLWGGAVRAAIQLEPLAVDHVTYDDYLRSMPHPNVLGVVGVPPLGTNAIIELGVPLALSMVDRLLGGRGDGLGGKALRRPTDLETFLVRDLMQDAVRALGETLESVTDGPELLAMEYNPQYVQVAAPSDMVVVLSYRMTVSQGVESEGLLTLCYPAPMVRAVLERLTGHVSRDEPEPGADEAARQLVNDHIEDVEVELRVTLRDSLVPARDLAALAVGDVLRLDHRTDEPMRAQVGSFQALRGHVGRRGRRLALQVSDWVARPALPPPTALPPTEQRSDG